MSPHVCALCTAAVLWLLSSAQAGDKQPTAAELETLRSTLADLRQSRAANQGNALKRSLEELSAASATPQSAINAYVEAVRIEQFGDEPGASSRFQEWRKDSSDILSHPALRTAAQLHLKYLRLTLERAATPAGDPNLAAIVSYVREAVGEKAETANPDPGRLKREQFDQIKKRIKKLQDEPMASAPFVRAYRIGPLFAGLKDWEMAPGNLSSILDKTVRPILRGESDPRLIETWDLQIAAEQTLQSDRDRENPDSEFNRDHLPRLLWLRANDQYQIGDRRDGLQAMLSLVRGYPEHPDAVSWIGSLSDLVEKEAATQTKPTGTEPEAN